MSIDLHIYCQSIYKISYNFLIMMPVKEISSAEAKRVQAKDTGSK
jgi:hypothetical protein